MRLNCWKCTRQWIMNWKISCRSSFAKSGQIKSLLLESCYRSRPSSTASFSFRWFTASNDWLQVFQKHHSVRSAQLSGEAANGSMATIDEWKKCHPDSGYRIQNFNAAKATTQSIMLQFLNNVFEICRHVCKCISYIINT